MADDDSYEGLARSLVSGVREFHGDNPWTRGLASQIAEALRVAHMRGQAEGREQGAQAVISVHEAVVRGETFRGGPLREARDRIRRVPSAATAARAREILSGEG